MITIAHFSTTNSIADTNVGISITHLIKTEGMNAYATTIHAGEKIGCHAHNEGDEWYIILSGTGKIWTGDVIENHVSNIIVNDFSRGCVFCIGPKTAHQLVAIEHVELLFLCSASHLLGDRICFADLYHVEKQ